MGRNGWMGRGYRACGDRRVMGRYGRGLANCSEDRCRGRARPAWFGVLSTNVRRACMQSTSKGHGKDRRIKRISQRLSVRICTPLSYMEHIVLYVMTRALPDSVCLSDAIARCSLGHIQTRLSERVVSYNSILQAALSLSLSLSSPQCRSWA